MTRARFGSGWSLAFVASFVAAAAPPTITTHPQPHSLCAGDGFTLSVVATGGGLTYQWRKDDVEIPGATSASFGVATAAVEDTGVYDVIVTNGEGSATSDGAEVEVRVGPEIATDPADASVCEGGSVTFGVTLAAGGASEDVVGSSGSSGTGPRLRGNFFRVTTATTLTRIEHYLGITTAGPLVFYVYESAAASGPYTLLLRDDVAAAGPGTRFYSSNPLSVPLQAGRYYLIGAGWAGSHAYYFAVGPNPPPHPKATSFGATLSPGGFQSGYADPLPNPAPLNTSSFAHYQRVTTSSGGLTYQWRKNDAPISGGAGPTLTLSGVTADDAALYDVLVTDQCGQTLSAAAELTVEAAPTVTQSPEDQAACVGDDVVFSVVASGQTPTYQWRKDAVDLPGEVSETLVLAAVAPEDAGAYDVVVGGCASATSDAAELTVLEDAPAITVDPVGGSHCEGAAVTLSVTASGGGLSYQWRKDDVEIAGATTAELQIPSVSAAEAGVYDVVVSNACGTTASAGAAIDVVIPLAILTQPVGADLCVGDGLVLLVEVGGDDPAYQWRRDGVDIGGANGPAYELSAAQAGDAGRYTVVVTNGCGSVTSDAAVVRVAELPLITRQPRGATVDSGAPLTLSVRATSGGTQASETVGTTGSSSSGPRIRANTYAVTEDATLLRIEHDMTITTAGDVRFFLYEGTTEAGPWTLRMEDRVVNAGPGAGFVPSSPLTFPLLAGRYYLIGAAWPGNHTYYWGGSHPHSVQFGQTVAGRSLATSYQDPLPANPTNTSPLVHRQRLTTTRSDLTYAWRRDGVLLPGAEAPALSLAAVGCEDAGNYTVEVLNPCGATHSATALVVVRGCPPFGDPADPPASSGSAGSAGGSSESERP